MQQQAAIAALRKRLKDVNVECDSLRGRNRIKAAAAVTEASGQGLVMEVASPESSPGKPPLGGGRRPHIQRQRTDTNDSVICVKACYLVSRKMFVVTGFLYRVVRSAGI